MATAAPIRKAEVVVKARAGDLLKAAADEDEEGKSAAARTKRSASATVFSVDLLLCGGFDDEDALHAKAVQTRTHSPPVSSLIAETARRASERPILAMIAHVQSEL